MKHLFVPYELAVKLKEKEFKVDCIAYYNSDEEIVITSTITENNSSSLVAAPIYQQLIDWFIEKHDIHINQIPRKNYFIIDWSCYSRTIWGENRLESLQKGIEEALKLI